MVIVLFGYFGYHTFFLFAFLFFKNIQRFGDRVSWFSGGSNEAAGFNDAAVWLFSLPLLLHFQLGGNF